MQLRAAHLWLHCAHRECQRHAPRWQGTPTTVCGSDAGKSTVEDALREHGKLILHRRAGTGARRALWASAAFPPPANAFYGNRQVPVF